MRISRLRMLAAASPLSISSTRSARNSPLEMAAPRAEQSSYFTSETISKTSSLARPSAGETLGNPANRSMGFRKAPVVTRQEGRDVWDLSSDGEGRDEGMVAGEVGTVLKGVKSRAAVKEKVVGKTKAKAKPTKATAKEGKAQGKIEGGKVTKPGTKTRKTAEKTATSKGGKEEDEPLGLEKVVPRRRDWTPVKSRETSFVNIDELMGGGDSGASQAGLLERTESQTNSLKGLLGGFGYGPPTGETSAKEPQRTMEFQPPLKKRKLDLIAATVPIKPLASVAKKDKAPKKKALTITELATKDYMQNNDALHNSASLMDDFLAHRPAAGSPDPENEAARMAEALNRNSKKTKSRSKVVVKPKSRLLTPERAIQATESQDLLFGTSSQLVREDSPTFIRDLQHALKESETSFDQESLALEAPRPLSAGKKSLWSAAIRNTDGSLMEAETVDLTKSTRSNTPRVSIAGAFRASIPVLAPPTPDPAMEPHSADEETSHVAAAVPIPSLDDEELQISLPKSIAEAACRTRPRSKSPTKKSKPRKSDEPSTASSKKRDKADFNTWTVVQLAKQIKNYGFKPVKGKAAMVALLEKCAESMKEREAAESEEVQSPHFAPADKGAEASTTKGKAKGKTTKQKAKGKGKEKEVVATEPGAADSEAPPQVPASPPPKPSSKSSSIKNAKQALATSTSDEIELLESITKAIKTFPPTYDMKHLSWYEKILMYDPIVLEDLTTWLNTVGLGRVNVDDEVWPALVRTWCEKHSVCCLWRENLRGGKRARY